MRVSLCHQDRRVAEELRDDLERHTALNELTREGVSEIVKAKPSGSKGVYIRTITLTTTMGPGIKLDPTPTLAMKAPV